MNVSRSSQSFVLGGGRAPNRAKLLQATHGRRPSPLDRSLTTLPGVGPALAAKAARLGLSTLGDLLGYMPFDYRDYEGPSAVSELALGEQATVDVRVRSCRVHPTRRRNLTMLECEVADDSGPMRAVWFNQAYLADQLTDDTRVLLRGTLRAARGGPVFRVAEHEIRRGSEQADGRHTTGLVAVYPATEGLSARKLRDMVWASRDLVQHALEPLPARIRARDRLPGKADALTVAHWPESIEQVEPARRRLAFEELLLFQLALVLRRSANREERNAEQLREPGELIARWLDSLPFELTTSQHEALGAIDEDLVSGHPMQRLLMGEVGSGKTVVALYAMLRAAEAGKQAALMAPTETLAEQHYATIERLVGPDLFAGIESTRLGAPVALLTGSTPARERREILARLASGELRLLVGTHALIQDAVEFEQLALAVVDEQHRFGVRQRGALDAKAPGMLAPHLLHLTATPIPRTLSLTLYGDLHTTALRELPAGRKAVQTRVVSEPERADAYELIRARLREGRQCYVVCPLVEESEQLQARAATHEARHLAAGEFADFRVDVMHGQMPAVRKREAMARFVSGETNVLVSTSVIEVGIDVPNATVMMVEEADRYGISQLHQLRGRVGRGEHESLCMLFAGSRSQLGNRRLKAVAAERDGFKLAEIDLQLRGEGDLLGTKQHGLPEFRAARLPEDSQLLEHARRWAIELLAADPELRDPENALLRVALERRHGAAEATPIAA
ncbi:MAG: ATP-dependent DNA helicase RecG [Solirubrobacterales bacterium]